MKILDHLAQRKRVLPHIAEAYALRYAALNLNSFYGEVADNLFNKGDDSQLSEVSMFGLGGRLRWRLGGIGLYGLGVKGG